MLEILDSMTADEVRAIREDESRPEALWPKLQELEELSTSWPTVSLEERAIVLPILRRTESPLKRVRGFVSGVRCLVRGGPGGRWYHQIDHGTVWTTHEPSNTL
jgi:hypothetical protein